MWGVSFLPRVNLYASKSVCDWDRRWPVSLVEFRTAGTTEFMSCWGQTHTLRLMRSTLGLT